MGSARLPSVGEESTHPLLVAEEQVSAVCIRIIAHGASSTELKISVSLNFSFYCLYMTFVVKNQRK